MPFAESVRNAASRLIPPRLKDAVKQATMRLFENSSSDRSSTLKIGRFGAFDVAYRQGTADESVLTHSFDNDIFFASIPEYQPSETDVIVDVGAHIGTFAVLAASVVPRGAVYAIEACQDSFNFLRINAALNRMGNLWAHHLAISNTRGTCTLYHDVGNWGHSIVRRLSDRSETVECCTLQEFFEKAEITKCNFVKFNCEGAEFPILLSSPADLLRRVHIMLVLYHCDLWPKNSREDLISHLQACGFECVLRNCTESRGWIVAMNRTSQAR